MRKPVFLLTKMQVFLCNRKFLELPITQKRSAGMHTLLLRNMSQKCDAKAAQNIAKRYSLFYSNFVIKKELTIYQNNNIFITKGNPLCMVHKTNRLLSCFILFCCEKTPKNQLLIVIYNLSKISL